jgi:hypothetical protein
MVADQLDYVVGVDPHRDKHALGVVDVCSGVVVFETSVAADSGGYADALAVAETYAPGRRAFAVEGTGSYGAGLTRFLTGSGERVFEVGRLPKQRHGSGKTDALDAVRAARSVLAQERPAMPRSNGEREALRALMAAREGAVNAKRAGLCQLRDLLVTTPEPLRAELRPLTQARLLARLAATRPQSRQDPELRGALLALRSVARRIQQLIVEERELAREIKTLTETVRSPRNSAAATSGSSGPRQPAARSEICVLPRLCHDRCKGTSCPNSSAGSRSSPHSTLSSGMSGEQHPCSCSRARPGSGSRRSG